MKVGGYCDAGALLQVSLLRALLSGAVLLWPLGNCDQRLRSSVWQFSQ
jgi:hypothetical protein